MSAVASIMSAKQSVPVGKIKPYPKNPRIGNIEIIAESLREHGQFQPLVVQQSSGFILAGNHTYKAALTLGMRKVDVVYVDVDDERAAKIVLAANRTSDLASYDTELLTEILSSLPTPVGTGYDDAAVRALLAGMADRDADLINEVVRPPVRIDFEGTEEAEWDLNAGIDAEKARHDARWGDQGNQAIAGTGSDIEEMRVAESIAGLQYTFDQYIDKLWPSSNYWGIPDLRADMLLDELPDPLDTWGGEDATPDDGTTTWLWNAGVASSKNLPWDRTIVSFFTYDDKFDSWFDQPSFQVARMIHNGCTRAVVPDTSFWVDDTRFHHLSAAYNAQWLARFMQECGVRVIPRLMWCDLESIKVGTLGVPKNPPIAAVCIQAISKAEVAKQMSAEGLRLFVKEIAPDALIVYGGGTSKQIVADAHLPKSMHVVLVDNYAHKRRGVVFDNPTGKALVDKVKRAQAREAQAQDSEDESP